MTIALTKRRHNEFAQLALLHGHQLPSADDIIEEHEASTLDLSAAEIAALESVLSGQN